MGVQTSLFCITPIIFEPNFWQPFSVYKIPTGLLRRDATRLEERQKKDRKVKAFIDFVNVVCPILNNLCSDTKRIEDSISKRQQSNS